MCEQKNLNEEAENLRDQYEEYVLDCSAAIGYVLERIKPLKESMKRDPNRPYSLIDKIGYRIKTFASAIDKCDKKRRELCTNGEELEYSEELEDRIDIEEVKKYVKDVAGVRIITPFEDDIFKLVEIIKKLPHLNIRKEKDYITNPKSNGYEGYHLIMEVEVFVPEPKWVPVEVQIRDLTMDAWATIEHITRYKKDNIHAISDEKYRGLADDLAKARKTAMELRNSSANYEQQETRS